MLEEHSSRELLQFGNQHVAELLVRRYMLRLTALTRSRMSRRLVWRVDSEDVVLSAWRSFFVYVERDRFHVPADDSLWPLLAANSGSSVATTCGPLSLTIPR